MLRVLVAGGDKRSKLLAKQLAEDGFLVETLGLEPEQKGSAEPADVVLLPYPFSVKNGYVPALTDEKIRPQDLLKRLAPNALVIAGRGIEGYITQENVRIKRYMDAEGLEEQNAELSAEAAVCEAMLHCRLALMDAKVLVTGYGLFGRLLALRLKSFGARVWVAARRERQREQAVREGMNAIPIHEIADVLPQMDLVLNTVPACVMDESALRRVPKGCCLLELASAPYGFDFEKAKLLGVSCVALPGLPARYSPLSAALRLKNAVKPWLQEA